MGFNYKSWLVCMRGIRAYKQRRPWTFPVLCAWGCVSGMLQGSDVPCHNSSEEANPNCSGIGSFSLSCLPKLWCSPCRYTEQMSRSSHREGHPSPRGVHQLHGWPKVLPAHICIIVFIFIFPLGHVAAREKESQDSSGGVLLLPAEFSWRAASVAPSARCPHTSKDCRSGNREFSCFTSEILVTKRKSFVSKDCR